MRVSRGGNVMAKAHGGVYSIAIDIWVTWEGRVALVYVYSCCHNCNFLDA